MDRRHLLKAAAAIALLPGAGAMAGVVRRTRPSDATWPSAADWAGLNRAVGGNLVRPVSLQAPCEAAPASAACAALPRLLRNPFYLGDQAAGTQVSGWLDAWTPALSAYAVAAHSTADVVAAVKFARRHNLRLAVKGGGHSYQGTSNAPDSLLVWTRAMHAITLHDAFVGQGCAGRQAPTPAVSVGAGAMWVDAYDAVTTKAGRYVQGGGCTTVGVAGLVHGGGFGSFSKQYGTAASSLLEAEVVTADGATRVVNACRDPDLFWAIKGGGGGSLGVITRLTLRTHDLAERAGGASAQIKAASDEAFRCLIGRFVAFYADSLLGPHWGESVSIRPDNRLDISMVSLGLTTSQSIAIWKPFFDWVAASPGDFTLTKGPVGALPARDWWRTDIQSGNMRPDPRPGAPPNHAWWSGDEGQVSAFLHGYDSLWLPVSLLAPAEQGRLADALFAASRHMGVALHFNKGLAGAPDDAIVRSRDTATNPDVLTAFALAIIATGGLPPFPGVPKLDLAIARRNAANVDAAAAELRKVAPRAGSYVSESNYFNAAWREAFWGVNYPRLKAVKAKYDPAGLFIVHHGVGSEDWSADGFTRAA